VWFFGLAETACSRSLPEMHPKPLEPEKICISNKFLCDHCGFSGFDSDYSRSTSGYLGHRIFVQVFLNPGPLFFLLLLLDQTSLPKRGSHTQHWCICAPTGFRFWAGWARVSSWVQWGPIKCEWNWCGKRKEQMEAKGSFAFFPEPGK
jgi:hypothetical protein